MAQQLTHQDQFADVLSDYQPSEAAINVLRGIDLTLLIAPSGVGRDTIMNQLVELEDYVIALTDTTRQPRVNDGQAEQDGVEYYFRTEQQMLDELETGKIVEASIIHQQQVSGMRLAELERADKLGKYVIADVDIAGVEHYRGLKPDTTLIFVLPPDLDTWLKRMTGRGQLDQDEIHRRLKSAESELQHALDHDYYQFVVNDQLEQAVKEVDQIVHGSSATDQTEIRDTLWQLLNELKRKLYS